MADQVNWTNILLRYCFVRCNLNGQFINLNFISRSFYTSQPHHTLLSRHSLLTFAVSVMLNFLEIKYQGKNESPFETHPKTMLVAVTSVILYFFSYDVNLRISSSTHRLSSIHSYVCVVRMSMAFFGPLSLASLSSLLFPGRLCAIFVFSASILFSLWEFTCSKYFRILRNWLQRVMNLCPAEADQRGRRGRRRRPPASSVYLPGLSLSEHTSELMEQVENLPV